MNAETPAELFAAVQAERDAKIVAAAFRITCQTQWEADYLQNALRKAWDADARAASARLARMALIGADGIRTGSRGNAARNRAVEKTRQKSSRIEMQSRARRALIMSVLRNKPSTKREVMLATMISSVSVTTAFKQLIRDGKVKRVGKDGPYFVYGAAE